MACEGDVLRPVIASPSHPLYDSDDLKNARQIDIYHHLIAWQAALTTSAFNMRENSPRKDYFKAYRREVSFDAASACQLRRETPRIWPYDKVKTRQHHEQKQQFTQ